MDWEVSNASEDKRLNRVLEVCVSDAVCSLLHIIMC